MVSYRIEKLNDLLRSTIADILLKSIKDPRIGFVTITHVKTARDLKTAKVFVSFRGGTEGVDNRFSILQNAAPYIQRETGSQLRLKYTPRLTFILDQNLDYADKISALLDSMSQENE